MKPYPFVWVLCIPLMFALMACSGVGGGERSFTGSSMLLDYSVPDKIDNLEWIEIDGVRFTHYSVLDTLIQHLPYALYASESGFTENQIAPVDNQSIVLALVSRFEMVQNRAAEEGGERSSVRASHDLQLYGAALLRLTSEDGEPFTIRTSPNYPIPIRVLE